MSEMASIERGNRNGDMRREFADRAALVAYVRAPALWVWDEAVPFAAVDRLPDLKRFSQYWRVAQRQAMLKTGEQ